VKYTLVVLYLAAAKNTLDHTSARVRKRDSGILKIACIFFSIIRHRDDSHETLSAIAHHIKYHTTLNVL